MTAPTSTTQRVSSAPAAGPLAGQPATGTGGPACPKCGGPMWDNRDSKRNPRAPDFRCRSRSCDGVLWPQRQRAAAPSVVRTAHAAPSSSPDGAVGRTESRANGGNGLSALRRCYLDVTEFVLSEVRDVYARHGVRWSAGALASITATLFIAETKPDFWRQGYGTQATRERP